MFAIAFTLPAFVQMPVLWYYPLARTWAFETTPEGLAMDFMGRALFAIATALVALALTVAVARRWPRTSARVPGAVAAVAIAATLAAMALFAWEIATRVPTPVPLPAWYVPR